MKADFSGKVGLMSDPTHTEALDSREEYLQFIKNNQSFIMHLAGESSYAVNHPDYVVRILAHFALLEATK